MERGKVLIVDDEPDIRELIKITLEKMGLPCIDVEGITAAKNILASEDISICLTDMRLLDGDGIELVKYIQKTHEQIPVAVITAYGNMESAITALKYGAFDFVSKPVNVQILRSLIKSANKQIKTELQPNGGVQLLGDSASMQKLKQLALKVSKSQSPVMIIGDSGTGKELIAKLIHEHSARRDKPFVPVNCGAIPQDLMESEFFGYKKGSFTGANTDKDGLFQAADGGTLFLDEIAELPLQLQVKLLRAIQEKSIRPIGSQKEIFVDVRIISATHKNLVQLIQENLFRQDLYYRINVIELNLPRLADRSEDIPLLTNYFLQKITKELGIAQPTLTQEAKQALMAYQFPGNVRELENILARAATLCEKNTITLEDLNLQQALKADGKSSKLDATEIDATLTEMQKDIIIKALEKNKWHKTKTAKDLGITLRALRYRLKKFDIEG